MRTWLSTRNLARMSAEHPWRTIGAWAATLVVAGALIVVFLGDALTTEDDFTGTPESKAAGLLVDERMPATEEADAIDEVLVVRGQGLSVDDPAFRSAVERLLASVAPLGAEAVETYYETGEESLVSADRDTTIVPVMLADTSDENVDRLVETVTSQSGADFETYITGGYTADADFRHAADEDLKTGELFGIGAALVVLLLVFGAVVASVVPVVLALVSIVVALGLTALVGQAFVLSFFVVNMLVMMGLAVGIDYALFVVTRFREERSRGLEKLDAISVAGGTASRAVFISGVTVVLALLGMFLVPTTIFRSLATGAILVVLVTVVAAMTLLPAVLSLLGDRIDSLRVPFIGRRPVEEGARLLGLGRPRGDAAARYQPGRGRRRPRSSRHPAYEHHVRLRRHLDAARQLRLEAGVRRPRRGAGLRRDRAGLHRGRRRRPCRARVGCDRAPDGAALERRRLRTAERARQERGGRSRRVDGAHGRRCLLRRGHTGDRDASRRVRARGVRRSGRRGARRR